MLGNNYNLLTTSDQNDLKYRTGSLEKNHQKAKLARNTKKALK